MKKLSTILTAGTIALTLSTPVLAGSAGISRTYATAQPDVQTIAYLEQASEAAQREASASEPTARSRTMRVPGAACLANDAKSL